MPDDSIAGVPFGVTGGHRRIDRVLAENYLDGLGECRSKKSASSATTPSRKRPTCRTCGGCCKGRVDIIQAELARRRGELEGR